MENVAEEYGPNTAQVEAYLAQVHNLTDEQFAAAKDAAEDWDEVEGEGGLGAAWHAAWRTAHRAEREAGARAAVDAAVTRPALGGALDAALALVVRDLISDDHFDALTQPMRIAGVAFDEAP